MKHMVFAAAALLAAPAMADDSQRWFESASVLTQETGEGIYNAICVACHMPEGVGSYEGAGIYPALADNAMLANAGYPIHVVVNGQKGMPALGGVLNDAQVAEVVNYIRTNWGNTAEDVVTAEQVAAQRQ